MKLPNELNKKNQTSPQAAGQGRIQAACRELEMAIAAFDDDTDARENARREAEKLRNLRDQLNEIKRQLDEIGS